MPRIDASRARHPQKRADPLTAQARQYIQNSVAKADFDDMGELTNSLLNELGRQGVKFTDTQHREAIARCYALWLLMRSNEMDALKEALAKRLGKEPTEKKQLRMIVEALVPYGGSGAAEKKRAAKLHSRDKLAIEYLVHENIDPSTVVALGSRPGEGLDIWAERMAAIRRRNKPSPKPMQQTLVWKCPGRESRTYSFDATEPMITIIETMFDLAKKAAGQN